MKPSLKRLLFKISVGLPCIICFFMGFAYADNSLQNDQKVIIQNNYYAPGLIRSSFSIKKDVYANDAMAIDAKYYSKYGRLLKQAEMNRKYQNGTINYYYDTGEVFAVELWENNYRNGKTIFYYKNGNLLSVEKWVNNKRQGITKYYYENGSLEKEITYKNDLYDGEIREYSKAGKMISSTFWQRGKRKDQR